MATFVQISAPTPPVPPMHLGKRLLRQRERLGIPLDQAAFALQTDPHTLTALEAGDVIPPSLSRPLRAYLQSLEAKEPSPEYAAPGARDQGREASESPAPTPAPPPLTPGAADWDAGRLYAAINKRREALGLTWSQIAEQIGVSVMTLRKLPEASYLKSATRDKLAAWLDRPATATATEAPDPPTVPNLDADSSAVSLLAPVQPDILDGAEALSNPSPAVDEPIASDVPSLNPGSQSLDPGPQPQPPVDNDPRPLRMFNSLQFHLPRPSGRDVALLALLDKFPDYSAMTSAGEQSQWFRYFESFARLALAGHDQP